ncbi:MAG: hypothetical protein IPN93_13355 [Bacteroidetes bacterium]|nr:hypothetical protein [Bacteroidota bacterium]
MVSYGSGAQNCATGTFNALGGSTATVSLPNAVINTVGTYTLRTIFTDGSGCKDTACATITVAAQPTINVPPTYSNECYSNRWNRRKLCMELWQW